MKAIKLLLTALALLLAYAYLRHVEQPYPWPMGGARWDMEMDYIEVKGRVS